MLPEFLHEVFLEFSNTDEENKPTITYSDLKQMFRLSNIISRDGKRVDSDLIDFEEGIEAENKIDF